MNQERILTVLLSPHVSEKAANAAELSHQYVFKVASDASKPEIRGAVEQLFDVKVASVRTVNIKGKVKRTGGRLGRRNSVRKAYVALQPGFEIDLIGPQ